MPRKKIYLLDPYNDVIKVTASGLTEFTLKLNGACYYSKAELRAAIDAIPFLNPNEDLISKIARWISADYSNQGNLRANDLNACNILEGTNSFSDDICGGLAQKIFNIYSLFYDAATLQIAAGGDGSVAHVWNGINHGFFDQICKVPKYKARYVLATLAEIAADKYLYTEPIRRYANYDLHASSPDYVSYITTEPASENGTGRITAIDNLRMVLPSGGSITFPIKSTYAPLKDNNAGSLPNWATLVGDFAAGVIGNVEMPATLIRVTGTGVVRVSGTNYTLPADATSLINFLMQGDVITRWYHSFEIISNSGGLQAEFLINRKRWLLFKDNFVDYTIASGALVFERVKTLIPIPTVTISVDKGDSASWTINYDRYFSRNKSFKFPLQVGPWDAKLITFNPNLQGLCPIPIPIFTASYNDAVSVKAGTAVIDQCWSSKLYPRQETFTTTLELSFTKIDGEDIHYTIDGSTPTASSTLYSAPFTISATTTIKWICTRTGYANSHVNSRTITKS
jgi:hypothetical protein